MGERGKRKRKNGSKKETQWLCARGNGSKREGKRKMGGAVARSKMGAGQIKALKKQNFTKNNSDQE